jgi:hypothetical protein
VRVEPDRATVEVVGPVRDEATDRAGDGDARATAATVAAINDRVDAFGGAVTITESGGRRNVRAWLPLDAEGAAA